MVTYHDWENDVNGLATFCFYLEDIFVLEHWSELAGVIGTEISSYAPCSGSRDVRLACLQALHRVVMAVGDPDDLAFFLPGLASGLARQLLPPSQAGSRNKIINKPSNHSHIFCFPRPGVWSGSGSPSSGTGAGSICLVSALNCLTHVMAVTLADERATETLLRYAPGGQPSSSEVGAPGGSASSAMIQLRNLSLAASSSASPSHAHIISSTSSTETARGVSTSVIPSVSSKPEGAPKGFSLRVARTATWLRESGGRVSGLLSRILPPLCRHPRASVREAAAASATKLLRLCCRGADGRMPGDEGGVLGAEGARTLLDVILTLAQDEWQQVGNVLT